MRLEKLRDLSKRPSVKDGLVLLVPLAVLLWGLFHFYGFVQDDAFISLRYAQNLVKGNGLVFNVGERTEGFTNMGWTLLAAGFEKLNLPSIRLWQGLGQASAVGLVVVCMSLGRDVWGRMTGFAAALLMATCTTMHLWSVSALENTPFTLLLMAAILQYAKKREKLAFLLMGLAEWVRPEATLGALVLACVRARTDIAEQTPWRFAIKRLGVNLGIFVLCALPLFAFRRWYYGTWVPNTFLVKGSATFASHHLGLVKLLDYANSGAAAWIMVAAGLVFLPSFDEADRSRLRARPRWVRHLLSWVLPLLLWIALLLVQLYLFSAGYLAPGWNLLQALKTQWTVLPLVILLASIGALGIRQLAFFPQKFREHPALACLSALWIGYLYYYMRVGGDAMRLHRLFLPGMAVQSVLAVAGAVRVVSSAPTWARWFARIGQSLEVAAVRGALFGVAGCWLGAVGVQSVMWTRAQLAYNAVESSLDRCQGEAGRMLQAVAAKHEFKPVVLAQDLGKMTVEAPDVHFIDSTGLITRHVAETVREYRYNPYWRYLVWSSQDARAKIAEMEGRLRDYYTNEVKPDYAVINVDVSSEEAPKAQAALEPMNVNYWRTTSGKNDFFYRWATQAYFRQNYILEKVFSYSRVAYLTIWRRKDRPTTLPPAPSEPKGPATES